jgi:hypothetical protein
MNVLTDETKSDRIEFGLAQLRELKVSPTVKALLLEEKPANMGWGEFAVFAMLTYAFIARIIRFDIGGVIRLGVRLIGARPDESRVTDSASAPSRASVGSPDDRRRPVIHAAR